MSCFLYKQGGMMSEEGSSYLAGYSIFAKNFVGKIIEKGVANYLESAGARSSPECAAGALVALDEIELIMKIHELKKGTSFQEGKLNALEGIYQRNQEIVARARSTINKTMLSSDSDVIQALKSKVAQDEGGLKEHRNLIEKERESLGENKRQLKLLEEEFSKLQRHDPDLDLDHRPSGHAPS
jgi:hypothetical protein